MKIPVKFKVLLTKEIFSDIGTLQGSVFRTIVLTGTLRNRTIPVEISLERKMFSRDQGYLVVERI